jgi:Lrp/AsnC family transcriptional regulator
MPIKLTSIDQAILQLLQRDAALSTAEIAEQVGLSQSPCWRRIRRLEEAGAIKRRVAILDHAKLGMEVVAFVSV